MNLFNPEEFTIYIVDNNFARIESAKSILSPEGYTIKSAPSWNMGKNSISKSPPDILLLSIDMVKTENIDIDKILEIVPILFICNAAQSIDHEKAYNLGGVGYVDYPYIPVEVNKTIQFHLSFHSLQSQLEQSVSAQKGIEKKLKNAWNYYQDIVELSPDIIHSVNNNGDIIATNQRATEILGYSREELLNMNIHQLYSPDELHLLDNGFDKLKHNGVRLNIESALIAKDGTRIPVEISSTSRYDDKNKFIATRSIIRDITERKKVEEELRNYREHLEELVAERTKELKASEQRFREIIEHAEAGYIFIDKNGIIQNVNNAWLKMHEYTHPAEIIGKEFSSTQQESDVQTVNQTIKQLLNGENISSGEFRRKCADGSIGYHTLSLNTVKKEDKIIGIEGFFIDTTSQKLALMKEKENLTLKHELGIKEAKLQEYALRLSLKNSLLDSLKTEVKKIKEEISSTLTQKIDELSQKIDAHKTEKEDWDLFEIEFNKTHQNFTHRLVDKYPTLTNRQIKICVLIRIHLTSSEIADMLYLSTRSVESQRYRIRKKIGLDTGENLATYLASL